ncbi:AIM24 family protein [Frankia sp. CNm7]|uniref:AIM24 family protein n=2 Tax=Frankia nepalensis TaxID=1836974 RepID=A0A937REP4_9ACTN|nr:AIM24 family protein [Frankia nepalensis]MBL7496496.1 AIM24 family protein [Frankia nepalensis]MBL7511361.1 AIM24 family protein [Frankia nepalensis]MBL7519207.1 AIM24 family protein [Frankia nepalensis]MBL7627469.1 AIM24 family protein [Frankia nepalensis]
MLRVRLDGGEMFAKQGSMVAYKGRVDFAYKSQGVGGFIRRAVTGEGQDLMTVKGQGIVWFAESGSHISIFNLDNDSLNINGRSLLALQSGLRYKITTTSGGLGAMVAGGVFNTEVSGNGAVAVLCLGSPLVLPTDEPVCVDRDAAVAWTSGVQTRVVSSFKVGNLLGRSSGELAQIEYSGRGGFVVVQCGEIPAAGTGSSGGSH